MQNKTFKMFKILEINLENKRVCKNNAAIVPITCLKFRPKILKRHNSLITLENSNCTTQINKSNSHLQSKKQLRINDGHKF